MNPLVNILKESEIRRFVFKNFFKLPLLGKKLFAEEARKIILKLKHEHLILKLVLRKRYKTIAHRY
jgi:hypothetical protein